jgi:hypothetical protein
LLIGVDDSGCIVGTASVISNAQKKKIYDKTGQKLDVEEVFDEAGKRVLVVSIPSRGVGKLLRYAGSSTHAGWRCFGGNE